jgi:hypothetical protein
MAVALCATAPRAEEALRGSRLICDTVEQVEAYIKADEDGEPNPMATVNANGLVCASVQSPVSEARNSKSL